MKTTIAFFTFILTLAFIFAFVYGPTESKIDSHIYQVICTEEYGSDQIYEYVAETQQSPEFEKEFCQYVTK